MTKGQKQALVQDVIDMMEQWAPAWLCESWDRVGLMTGQPQAKAERIWVALELSDTLLEQALDAEVDLLLLHHPPIFKPLADLRGDRPSARRLVRAAAKGLALFAAHSNLDSASGGVNDVLATCLGLLDTRPLVPASDRAMHKLVTFLPPEALEGVTKSIFAAGAGRIGDYRECYFSLAGKGGYLTPAEGRPYKGRPGERQVVDEIRLETVVPAACSGRVIAALLAAHPYQEPALDLYPLANPPAGVGLGRVGNLARPLAGKDFIAQAKTALAAPVALLAGALPAELQQVAVVGGSGGDLVAAAAAAGAQMLVTGEARHHAAQEAADLGLGLLCLGHFQTENLICEPWARRLQDGLAAAGLSAQVRAWSAPAPPWRAL